MNQWQRMGEVGAAGPDRIVEHGLTADADGRASLTSPNLGLVAEVAWDRSTMPRLHTWQRVQRGSYVASIEPANCGLGGREADRTDGRAPVLGPGEERSTRVEIALRPEATA